ncbi:2576_t:CDS:2 [Funneliformis caledonium]|uniref:2576_t:CDS:1 n=1 Tax=Funneliformis caledonium TaxID=1117310 RepID=A0A9N9D7B6_9GLOM|nr:2576_t:CDS:2 [Funneliformis caledonium]
MDSSILDYARFYHEFKPKNPNPNVEIEAEYLKLQGKQHSTYIYWEIVGGFDYIRCRVSIDTYRTNANVAASAYYSNLDLTDKKGKNVILTRNSEHNLSNNNFTSIVKSVLKRDKVSDDEWKKRLRKARYHLQIHEDITHLEMIRQSYQISFAVFGVNESVYPCLARNNDNDNVIEDVSLRTRTSVNLIRQLILAKANPIQNYNAEVDKEKVREMMIKMYRTKKEKVLATEELKEMFGNLDIIEEDEWEHDVYGEGVYEIDEGSDVSNSEEDGTSGAAEEAVGSAIGMDSMKLMGQAIKLEAEAEYQTRKAQEQAQEFGDNAYQSVKGTFGKFTGGQNENDEEANKK